MGTFAGKNFNLQGKYELIPLTFLSHLLIVNYDKQVTKSTTPTGITRNESIKQPDIINRLPLQP